MNNQTLEKLRQMRLFGIAGVEAAGGQQPDARLGAAAHVGQPLAKRREERRQKMMQQKKPS